MLEYMACRANSPGSSPVAVGDIEQCLGGPYRSLHKTLSVGIFTYQR